MTRVLVTGAGGPAGVAVIRSLLNRDDLTVFAADMDGWASGLYLVPAARRRLVEPGRSPAFIPGLAALVAQDAIDVVISTVDVELAALAERRDELAPAVLAAPSADTIATCLDKLALAERCAPTVRVPRTVLAAPDALAIDWEFPDFAKPRSGAGSRGIRVVPDRAALEALPTDEGLIVQDLLPGEEYSVDVIADAAGRVVAAVPRTAPASTPASPSPDAPCATPSWRRPRPPSPAPSASWGSRTCNCAATAQGVPRCWRSTRGSPARSRSRSPRASTSPPSWSTSSPAARCPNGSPSGNSPPCASSRTS